MKAMIFTEGGRNIGFGHVARCISLYQTFKKNGIMPQMLVDGDTTLENLLRGINYRFLKWADNKEELRSIMERCDIAIIDSYLASRGVYKQVARSTKITVYIDDYNRIKYPKGIVINSNIYAKNIKFRKTIGVTYLLGTRFSLLRKEFWKTPVKKINKRIANVLLTFGGDDSIGLTSDVLKMLKVSCPGLIKKVIITNAFRYMAKIKHLEDTQTEIIYNVGTNKIKEIMLQVDLAISAAGQTLFELARIGVPTVAVIYSKNQVLNALSWFQEGFIALAGERDDKNIASKILKKISEVQDYKIRSKMSRNGCRLVDGSGAERVVRRILNHFERIR